MEEIIEYIIAQSHNYDTPIEQIQLSVKKMGNDYFVETWRFIETGVIKNDQWQLLETKKIQKNYETN